MTATQYRSAIAALGLSQVRAAKFLGVSIRTSWGYANGEPIPESTAILLRLMVDRKIAPHEIAEQCRSGGHEIR